MELEHQGAHSSRQRGYRSRLVFRTQKDGGREKPVGVLQAQGAGVLDSRAAQTRGLDQEAGWETSWPEAPQQLKEGVGPASRSAVLEATEFPKCRPSSASGSDPTGLCGAHLVVQSRIIWVQSFCSEPDEPHITSRQEPKAGSPTQPQAVKVLQHTVALHLFIQVFIEHLLDVKY